MSVKRRPSASPEAPVSRIYEVRNAEWLRDLCGPHHRHLQLLETRLDEYGLKAESQGGGILQPHVQPLSGDRMDPVRRVADQGDARGCDVKVR